MDGNNGYPEEDNKLVFFMNKMKHLLVAFLSLILGIFIGMLIK